MPAAVVGRQIKVVELLGKVSLAPAPVDSQVFDQKARHHHAQPVVHIAAGVDLAHGGIDQRVAGAALAPCGEECIGFGTRVPFDHVISRLEAAFNDMRVVGQNLKVKVAPDQLAEPGGCAFTACIRPVAVMCGLMGKASQFANRHGAKAQVHAEVAGAFERRKVPRRLVLRQARQKVGQQLARAAFPCGQAQALQGVGRKAQFDC